MARKPRAEDAGAVHHVYARGNRSAQIFLDDVDRHLYLRLLGQAVREQEWACLSYCLMGNHVHLLIETPRPNLGSGMRKLHGKYGLRFNQRHGFVGHVFQGRYGAVRITDDEHLVTVLRYIDGNPVEAGLGSDWPWCSSLGLRGGPAPPWLALGRLPALLPSGQIDLADDVQCR